jgi:hypothetical protein
MTSHTGLIESSAGRRTYYTVCYIPYTVHCTHCTVDDTSIELRRRSKPFQSLDDLVVVGMLCLFFQRKEWHELEPATAHTRTDEDELSTSSGSIPSIVIV